MSEEFARVSITELNSKGDAKLFQKYYRDIPKNFPEAKVLLQIKTSETSFMMVTVYPDQATMVQVSERRKKEIENIGGIIRDEFSYEGEVTLSVLRP